MSRDHVCSRLCTADNEGERIQNSAAWYNTFLHVCHIHAAVDGVRIDAQLCQSPLEGWKFGGQCFKEQCDCPIPLGCFAVALPTIGKLFLNHSGDRHGLTGAPRSQGPPSQAVEGSPWMGGEARLLHCPDQGQAAAWLESPLKRPETRGLCV